MNLNNVLIIAAWEVERREDFNALELRLVTIFKAVEDLRLALGEEVTDVDVIVVRPKALFDHRWMEDGYGDIRHGNTRNSHEVVAGTTGIGLKRVLPSLSGEELFENIISPKVVLVSTLQDALFSFPASSPL